ncbi:hypothetical protein FEM48_Zijuj08G0089300 [Ziziphus jujuba var. spinosa]|uniref:Uncharacterized protein n=1 Tax=Ziziphus jujuba var. spinosa TaxID=714518 RepID=A0A978UY61_ZIZJJ|nr:hypothetical protein FEM48_Zijuj08G0089300 [Ziziphus jujuba var. spinosa]
METPLSTRRVTRSQTSAALNNSNNIPISRKIEESETGVSKSRKRNGKQEDRSALIDITNDSPIVGLAMGSLETPSSSTVKHRGNQAKITPGSGEALLRGQVKNLLQKVEEEAELSKLSLESRPFLLLQNSPAGLLAPTPANTPQIPNLSGDGSLNADNDSALEAPSPIVEEQLISQEESLESQKSIITRSLLLDFSEKSEVYDSSECSSELTYQGFGETESERKEKPNPDDDDASIWSIQVNASTHDEDEEEEVKEEEDGGDDFYREEYDEIEEEEEDELVDSLCDGMSKINVNEEKKMLPKFEGKHIRFVYNSDDEIEENGVEDEVSPTIVRLKGLPTPKGKHLRFFEEEGQN